MLKPQLFLGYKDPDEHSMNPIINGYTSKPRSGGLWTSTYIDKGSAWVETVKLINYSGRQPSDMNWYIIYPKEQLKVFEIDCIEDCEKLYDQYGLDNSDFPQELAMRMIDFERIQRDYDCIHLTRRGQFETHNPLRYPNLNGWDCESTIWFRWCFEKWEKIFDYCDKALEKKR